jgi:hypothetical protein
MILERLVECESCAEFQDEVAIRSSKVLNDLIAKAAAAIADGTLVVVAGDLQWCDSMECELKCATCSRRFELSCETYHGGGGTWRIV